MLRLRAIAKHAPSIEADVRREYGLHPWEALDLPAGVFIRYVAHLSASSVTVAVMAANTPQSRTVPVEPPPRDEAEHRRRLSALRGYRQL
jgi:hypothetical protein